jgi:hypothetical protein
MAFLCSTLPAAVGIAAYWAGPAAGAAAAAMFALPLLYTVPRGRSLWARHRNWLLAAQALLTYLPFAAFRGGWIAGLSGLLGGLLLLTEAAPVSLLLFGATLAVEGCCASPSSASPTSATCRTPRWCSAFRCTSAWRCSGWSGSPAWSPACTRPGPNWRGWPSLRSACAPPSACARPSVTGSSP